MGMINVMSTIIGQLPPKCIDEDPEKVMRTAGVSGISKTATAIKPQLMTLLETSVFLHAQQRTLCTQENKTKQKASQDHRGGSKI